MMRARRLRGLLPVLILTGGCATRSADPPGPVVSPTGIVYEPGVPPIQTRYGQTATLFLRSDSPERALAQALEGIQVQPGNPLHHFLAGVAFARLGRYAEADAALRHAQHLYPAYELEIEPERLAAWAEAFNRGTEAYADGRDEDAVTAWSGAATMYNLRPEAHRNLAAILTQLGRLDRASEVHEDLLRGLARRPATRILDPAAEAALDEARVESERNLADLLLLLGRHARAEPLLRARLADAPDDATLRLALASSLAEQGRDDEARSIHESLLSEPALDELELYNLGVAFFRQGSPQGAADAFQRLIEVTPESRDAWFNYANALLASENWEGLAAAGPRLLAVDPLGESAGLLVARGYLESGDQRAALQELERIDATPVHLEGLALRPSGTITQLTGRVVGNAAEPGTRVRIRFYLFGPDGAERTERILIAPVPGASEPFDLSLPVRATAYRYEIVEGPIAEG